MPLFVLFSKKQQNLKLSSAALEMALHGLIIDNKGELSFLNSIYAGYLCMLLISSTDFFSIFSQNFFREHYHSVKRFGSIPGSAFCRSWSGSNPFARAISRRPKSPLST